MWVQGSHRTEAEFRTHFRAKSREENHFSEATVILFNHFVAIGRNKKLVRRPKWQGAKNVEDDNFNKSIMQEI